MKKARFLVCSTILFVFILCAVAYAGFISEISEITFNSEVLECDIPVLVWFYFVEDIRISDPYRDGVDDFAKKNVARIKTLKMDSKFNSITASKYNIKRNNTFVIFVDGEEKSRSEQIRSAKDLAAFVDQCIPPLDPKKK